MGKGLDRMSRSRRAKLPLTIEEGRTRPYNPMIAAKFATECNIAVRNHMPVFKHWKDYKKKPLLLKDYIGKVGVSIQPGFPTPLICSNVSFKIHCQVFTSFFIMLGKVSYGHRCRAC